MRGGDRKLESKGSRSSSKLTVCDDMYKYYTVYIYIYTYIIVLYLLLKGKTSKMLETAGQLPLFCPPKANGWAPPRQRAAEENVEISKGMPAKP